VKFRVDRNRCEIPVDTNPTYEDGRMVAPTTRHAMNNTIFAEAAGMQVNGEDRWVTLIQSVSKK
jgi:hypothetical protein